MSDKKQSRLEDIPESAQQRCVDLNHNPPSHIAIPGGKQYRHICPSCGIEQVVRATQITFGNTQSEPSYNCEQCRDTGQIPIGTSGKEEDGNATEYAPCDCEPTAPDELVRLRAEFESIYSPVHAKDYIFNEFTSTYYLPDYASNNRHYALKHYCAMWEKYKEVHGGRAAMTPVSTKGVVISRECARYFEQLSISLFRDVHRNQSFMCELERWQDEILTALEESKS